MNSIRKALYTGAGLLSLAMIGTYIAPKVQAAVRAALVEQAIPNNPYYGLMTLSGTGSQSIGPGTGTLGVTLITITNDDSVVNQVNIFAPLLTGGTCGGTNNIGAGTNPFLVVKVQPNSTVVIAPSTPIVFSPATGYDNVPHTCVAAGMPLSGGNTVYVSVNGFVQ
jgi:hypothetical protein